MTATFTIAGNATVGATNVTITTSAGTSGAVTVHSCIFGADSNLGQPE